MKLFSFLTLRTKLSLTYALIVLAFGVLLLLGFNLLVSNFLMSDPPQKPIIQVRNGSQTIRFQDLSELERERIRQIRIADLQEVQNTSIFLLIPLTFASFALGYWASGLFLRPLADLSNQIKAIGKHNLGNTFKQIPPDEIGQIMQSFNQMSLNLKQAFDSQEAFVQNAAHEINTPLTALKLNLELGTLPSNNKAELQNIVQNSLSSAERLQALTSNLLNLAKTSSVSELESINLKTLVTLIITDLQDLVSNHSATVKVTINQNINVNSNLTSLRLILVNLISNAIKYGNGKVLITAVPSNSKILISVINFGEQIPQAELNNIFTRFYRLDSSRNSGTGGTGLGLAIASEHATAIGSKINVQSDSNKTEFSFLI